MDKFWLTDAHGFGTLLFNAQPCGLRIEFEAHPRCNVLSASNGVQRVTLVVYPSTGATVAYPSGF